MKAICVGHSTYDITLPVSSYPVENNKYRINNFIECGGGPAANAAYLLSKWGVDTSICSVVGNDYYGDKIVEEFNKVGANTKHLEKRDNFKTSSSYIVANTSNGSRTIITYHDRNIDSLKNKVSDKADVIVVDGEHYITAREVLENNKDAISIIDASHVNNKTIELCMLVKYLVCSHEFSEEFTKEKIDYNDINSLIRIHKKMEKFFSNNIVITLEAHGSFTKINGKYMIIPSIEVKALDSTGAGDIFHGALAYFLGNGYSLYDAIKLSSVTSAISVTRVGGRYSIPRLEEVMSYDDII